MEKIYIFGHRNPDTDSVCSSIALSYLKNKLGMNTVPVILSDINNETKFVLDYFNVKKPMFLNDVKLKIKDTDYRKNHFINAYESVYAGYKKMVESGTSKIPIVDDNQKFLSVLSMKNIATDQIEGNTQILTTSYDNIINTIGGESILKFDNKIHGELMIAGYKSTTFIENIKLNSDTILIVGDRHSIIEYAVNQKVKLIILTGNANIKEEHYNIALKNNVNIIRTYHTTFEVAKMINLCNYIYQISTTKDVLCVNEDMTIDEFTSLANKTKFSYYPVISKNEKCLGIVRLSDVGYTKKKKIILVDHNTARQSIEGIEEAEIIEIIDHHNLGNLGTSKPINFRNMPVGSTCTIIYLLFKENNIEIPPHIAGLLISGICSDTIILKSPTTTDIDRKAINELSSIASINYNEYALEMFKKGSSFIGKTKQEILYTDFKNYPIDNNKIGISQVLTPNPDEIIDKKDEFINEMNNVKLSGEYYLIIMLVTDILNNNSYILYTDGCDDIIKTTFNLKEIYEGILLENIVSRKLQVVPQLLDILEKK